MSGISSTGIVTTDNALELVCSTGILYCSYKLFRNGRNIMRLYNGTRAAIAPSEVSDYVLRYNINQPNKTIVGNTQAVSMHVKIIGRNNDNYLISSLNSVLTLIPACNEKIIKNTMLNYNFGDEKLFCNDPTVVYDYKNRQFDVSGDHNDVSQFLDNIEFEDHYDNYTLHCKLFKQGDEVFLHGSATSDGRFKWDVVASTHYRLLLQINPIIRYLVILVILVGILRTVSY
jgi:hypothetical protein